MANFWVGVVTWNDGSERNIEVVGIASAYDIAFAAVQARLIDETGYVIGIEHAGQSQGTVQDSNVTWDWAVESADLIRA